MTLSYSTDIVVFGGGVAGLWLLNRLRNEGYGVILLESNTLGCGQTVASQGIIHGGLKYAMTGSLTGASNVIADMPARWRNSLLGSIEENFDIDLSNVRVTSDHYYMWSDAGMRSKLKAFLGSKSLIGRVRAVPESNYPSFLADAPAEGTLYRLPDFVIDSSSLIEILADHQPKGIYQTNPSTIEFLRDDSGSVTGTLIKTKNKTVRIATQRIIFCAGEGNQALIEKAALKTPHSQVRPLNMVYVKRPKLPMVFMHCIGSNFSLTPSLTITSHQDKMGITTWYLGGELAESGVAKGPTEQIHAAKKLIFSLFPWIEFDTATWGCFLINRAEANINNNYRPDDACLIEEKNVLVAWPTKLTLTPVLADKTIEMLHATSVKATDREHCAELDSLFNRPSIANAPWS